MTEAVTISLISGAFSFAGIVFTVLTRNKLEHVSKQIDGKMTELLDLTRSGSHAEGKLEGKAEQVKEDRKK